MIVSTDERRGLVRAFAASAVVALAFAAPATVQLVQGQLAPNESRLGDAIAGAFGGVTLPIVAAAIATAILSAAAPIRAHADRLVAAGAEPSRVIPRPLAIALVASAVGAALAGAVTVALLRASLRLGSGGEIIHDMFATAWGNVLGAAAWTAIAAALVMRSGRSGRAWIVVAIDLVTRLLPGAVAWLSPGAHIANVLGAPPPRGFVHVPALSQWASVGVLLAVTALGALIAARRYVGAPAR